MKKSFKEIRTMKAPAPVGPYSQAIEANGMVFCSGQIALDAETGQMVGNTPAEQTEKLMDNVRAVLESAGLGCRGFIRKRSSGFSPSSPSETRGGSSAPGWPAPSGPRVMRNRLSLTFAWA